MTEIAGGRWDELLRRLFPVKGRAIAPSIAPELIGTVAVQPDAPENGLLRNERLYAQSLYQVAVAGQTQKVLLRNPAASEGLIIVEGIWWTTNVLTDLQLRLQPLPSPPVDLALPVAAVTRDTRQARGVATSAVPGFGITSFETSVAAGVGSIIWRGRSTGIPVSPGILPIVLAPDTALLVWSSTAAVELGGALFWRERAAEPSELRLQ
jgi:hypothetical protein